MEEWQNCGEICLAGQREVDINYFLRILKMKSKKPCPPAGPAHDGRGKGKGVKGGKRRGKK